MSALAAEQVDPCLQLGANRRNFVKRENEQAWLKAPPCMDAKSAWYSSVPWTIAERSVAAAATQHLASLMTEPPPAQALHLARTDS